MVGLLDRWTVGRALQRRRQLHDVATPTVAGTQDASTSSSGSNTMTIAIIAGAAGGFVLIVVAIKFSDTASPSSDCWNSF
jgi:hypothetical protein